MQRAEHKAMAERIWRAAEKIAATGVLTFGDIPKKHIAFVPSTREDEP